MPVSLCGAVNCGSHGSCVSTTGVCACSSGYGGLLCTEVVNSGNLKCFNNVLDAGESDVDCGGSVCNKCGDGRTCTEQADCVESTSVCTTSGLCTSRSVVRTGWFASGIVQLGGVLVGKLSDPLAELGLRASFAAIAASVVPYVTSQDVAILGLSEGPVVNGVPSVSVLFQVNVLTEADANLVKNALELSSSTGDMYLALSSRASGLGIKDAALSSAYAAQSSGAPLHPIVTKRKDGEDHLQVVGIVVGSVAAVVVIVAGVVVGLRLRKGKGKHHQQPAPRQLGDVRPWIYPPPALRATSSGQLNTQVEMNPSAVAALQLQHKSAAVAWAESQGAVGVANPMASIPAGGAIGAAGTGAGAGAGAARGVVGQARPGSLVFNPLMAAGGSGIVVTSPRAGGGTTLGAGAGAGAAGNVSPLPTARTARTSVSLPDLEAGSGGDASQGRRTLFTPVPSRGRGLQPGPQL